MSNNNNINSSQMREESYFTFEWEAFGLTERLTENDPIKLTDLMAMVFASNDRNHFREIGYTGDCSFSCTIIKGGRELPVNFRVKISTMHNIVVLFRSWMAEFQITHMDQNRFPHYTREIRKNLRLLENYTNLTSLRLNNIGLKSEDLNDYIIPFLRNSSITKLDLSENQFTNIGILNLFFFLKDALQIKVLLFTNKQLYPSEVYSSLLIYNTSLERVGIRTTTLDPGIFKNTLLHYLRVSTDATLQESNDIAQQNTNPYIERLEIASEHMYTCGYHTAFASATLRPGFDQLPADITQPAIDRLTRAWQLVSVHPSILLDNSTPLKAALAHQLLAKITHLVIKGLTEEQCTADNNNNNKKQKVTK